jgi:hypothetical protein
MAAIDIGVEEAAPAGAEQVDFGWLIDKNGKEYITRPGRPGPFYRKDGETIAEALDRGAKPRDERPKRKSKTAKKPPRPAKEDLRELEQILAEALRSPAVICAGFGDEWAANHFTNQGPALARNLVVASEHNPWLRKKLESAASGGDTMMQVVTMFGVGGALVGYAIPPIVYWANLPVPDKAREMFGIPPRREHAPNPAPAFAEAA